jgi:hypothetical protein
LVNIDKLQNFVVSLYKEGVKMGDNYNQYNLCCFAI